MLISHPLLKNMTLKLQNSFTRNFMTGSFFSVLNSYWIVMQNNVEYVLSWNIVTMNNTLLPMEMEYLQK